MFLSGLEEERSELRNHALQKIGRNVLNFQRIEKALKSLIVASNIRGHASDLAEIHRAKSEKVNRSSLGVLVKEFLSTVYANDLPTAEPSPGDDSSSEIWISFSLRVERDDQHIRAQREAWSRVVAERNALIHETLGAFDPSSDEDCRGLISSLDEQNERLLAQYELVTQMVGSVRSLQRGLLANLEDILFPTGRGSHDAA